MVCQDYRKHVLVFPCYWELLINRIAQWYGYKQLRSLEHVPGAKALWPGTLGSTQIASASDDRVEHWIERGYSYPDDGP